MAEILENLQYLTMEEVNMHMPELIVAMFKNLCGELTEDCSIASLTLLSGSSVILDRDKP